jgi:adenylate kinase
MRIVFFGPPGSGKGTQAKLIAEKFKISHLSTGDMLREKLKDKDHLSNQLKEIMTSGNLVSDDLLNHIISEKLINKESSNGFILDGYPRTLSQLDFLLYSFKKNNLNLDFIFNFKIDFKIVEERIIHRFQKEKRSDDNIDVIKTRLDKYMLETYPVSEQIKKKFIKSYFEIDASREVSEILEELMKIIKKAEI